MFSRIKHPPDPPPSPAAAAENQRPRRAGRPPARGAHRFDQQTHHREADARAAMGAGQVGRAGAAVDHVQHQLAGRPCAGGEGDRAIAVEQGVVRQGGGALL